MELSIEDFQSLDGRRFCINLQAQYITRRLISMTTFYQIPQDFLWCPRTLEN